MVELPDPPTVKVTLVGLALRVKSTKLNVALAVWIREPLVAVMVTVNEAAVVELQARVAVEGEGGSVTLAGVMAPQVRPAGTVSVRLTVPLNPLTPVMVIVDVPVEPTNICEGEVAETVKSVKWNVMALVVWASGSGLVPVTETE